MIIDFHTHIFPEKIAATAISKLENVSEGVVAHTDGTLAGLLLSMERAGVDSSVVLPVVTNPKQFDSINEFAAEHNGTKLIYFGGIHPDCDDIPGKLDRIKRLGLKGIKLHPDYQGVYIDDRRYVEIVREALKRGLLIAIHAGVDVGFPESVHCSPERSAKLLDAVDDLNDGNHIIFAHLGAYAMADDVLKHLCGRKCLFDTAYSLTTEDAGKIIGIIRAHGAERILFATDSPWSGQSESLKRLNSLPLTTFERERILGKNAMNLLKI